MSMSTYVVGFRPPDEAWLKMKAAWDACEQAGVDAPAEVMKFFDYDPPQDKPGQDIKLGDAVRQLDPESPTRGFEVDIAKLPRGLQFIRFYNTW